MSYKLMQNIKEELDRIAEKGLNTSNLETAYTVSYTHLTLPTT